MKWVYNPPISVIGEFKKLNLRNWNNYRLDKAKLKFYYVIKGLYYGVKVDNVSLLWSEFTNYGTNSKNSSEIACACFWSLILQETYNQVGIQVPTSVEISHYSQIQTPKIVVDDPIAFPVVG